MGLGMLVRPHVGIARAWRTRREAENENRVSILFSRSQRKLFTENFHFARLHHSTLVYLPLAESSPKFHFTLAILHVTEKFLGKTHQIHQIQNRIFPKSYHFHSLAPSLSSPIHTHIRPRLTHELINNRSEKDLEKDLKKESIDIRLSLPLFCLFTSGLCVFSGLPLCSSPELLLISRTSTFHANWKYSTQSPISGSLRFCLHNRKASIPRLYDVFCPLKCPP